MRGDADISAAAALLAEPARAALVSAVMDVGALPATYLAARAGSARSTASEHLASSRAARSTSSTTADLSCEPESVAEPSLEVAASGVDTMQASEPRTAPDPAVS